MHKPPLSSINIDQEPHSHFLTHPNYSLSLITTMASQKTKLTLSLTILLMLFCYARSDDKQDKEECTEQLVGLATCLPYVGGNAKSPTPDCCSGLKQVLNTNKKCLCVIIKDRNDPDLGLTINVTLALGLPTVCHAPANVSQCPGNVKRCWILMNFVKLILNENFRKNVFDSFG